MNLREFVMLREHGIALNEMPHVELFKQTSEDEDDYFIIDFRSEDGVQWIDKVINLFKKRETISLSGKTVKLPQSKMQEIEDNLSKNPFFINILKSDLKGMKNHEEKLKDLPQKIRLKVGNI